MSLQISPEAFLSQIQMKISGIENDILDKENQLSILIENAPGCSGCAQKSRNGNFCIICANNRQRQDAGKAQKKLRNIIDPLKRSLPDLKIQESVLQKEVDVLAKRTKDIFESFVNISGIKKQADSKGLSTKEKIGIGAAAAGLGLVFFG